MSIQYDRLIEKIKTEVYILENAQQILTERLESNNRKLAACKQFIKEVSAL